MRIKLTATTVWEVAPEDEEMAKDLLKDQPGGIIIDYIEDAFHLSADPYMSVPVCTAELLEDD